MGEMPTPANEEFHAHPRMRSSSLPESSPARSRPLRDIVLSPNVQTTRPDRFDCDPNRSTHIDAGRCSQSGIKPVRSSGGNCLYCADLDWTYYIVLPHAKPGVENLDLVCIALPCLRGRFDREELPPGCHGPRSPLTTAYLIISKNACTT